MSINIQHNGKLVRFSTHEHTNKEILDIITNSKIEEWNNKSDFSGDYNDLTNRPAALDSITSSKIEEWDSKSEFSGDYNDLTNKPDIVDDGSNQLLIVDDNGNIIFKVDEEGVHSINMTVNGMDVATQDFVNEKVADVHTHDNKDILDNITSEELLSDEQKAQISTAYNHSQSEHAPADAQKNSDITKAEIEAKLVGEIDSHGHAPLTYDEIVNAPDILEDGSGDINFVDEAGNIIFTIDSNGIHTTNIVADDSITSTSASINNISTNSLEIDGVNILTTVDSKINAKFTEIEEITDEEIDAIIASLDE